MMCEKDWVKEMKKDAEKENERKEGRTENERKEGMG